MGSVASLERSCGGGVNFPALTSSPLQSQAGKAALVAEDCNEDQARSRKKYRDRFNIDEEEALIKFWFDNRFKYSLKSRSLWRLAVRKGITERDAVAVQKHFHHILKNGRLPDLMSNLRCEGRLSSIIDSIDLNHDYADTVASSSPATATASPVTVPDASPERKCKTET